MSPLVVVVDGHDAAGPFGVGFRGATLPARSLAARLLSVVPQPGARASRRASVDWPLLLSLSRASPPNAQVRNQMTLRDPRSGRSLHGASAAHACSALASARASGAPVGVDLDRYGVLNGAGAPRARGWLRVPPRPACKAIVARMSPVQRQQETWQVTPGRTGGDAPRHRMAWPRRLLDLPSTCHRRLLDSPSTPPRRLLLLLDLPSTSPRLAIDSFSTRLRPALDSFSTPPRPGARHAQRYLLTVPGGPRTSGGIDARAARALAVAQSRCAATVFERARLSVSWPDAQTRCSATTLGPRPLVGEGRSTPPTLRRGTRGGPPDDRPRYGPDNKAVAQPGVPPVASGEPPVVSGESAEAP